MTFVKLIKNVGIGATAAVATAIALPFAGPVGAISATGATVASVIGGIAGAADSFLED